MPTFPISLHQASTLFAELLQTIGVQKFDICEPDDDIVVFRRRSTTCRIPASAIDEIDVRWTIDEFDKHHCHLHIWHGSRKVVVLCFPHADEFLAEMARRNPDMRIDGYLYTGERC